MKQSEKFNRGFAYILALLLLAVFSTLAVAFASSTDLGLQKSNNCRNSAGAQVAAESGLAFMLNILDGVRLPGSTTEETFCVNLRKTLADRLEGTANLAGRNVTNTGSSVLVPDIQVEGKSFCYWFTQLGSDRCQIKVRGSFGGVTRYVSMDLKLVLKPAMVFDYGMASRGKISIIGNTRILGVNDLSEASVISVTKSHPDAIYLEGQPEISGDLHTTGDEAYVLMEGQPTVAGTQDPDEIAKHVHNGVEEPDFPEIDTATFAALATRTLQPSDLGNENVYNNLLIPRGMNPTFGSDIVFNGVVYIEAPNDVRFEGQCTINGMVVTEKKGGEPIEICQLYFAGGIEAGGVESLPDTPEFADVKQHTGTFILAPGFGVTFAGNFSTINGSIAADQFTFTGTSKGTIKGSIIGLEDLPIIVGGNDILVDRSGIDQNPAGFVKSVAMIPVPGSYEELTP